jgi:iron complex outermembrane receptor protein
MNNIQFKLFKHNFFMNKIKTLLFLLVFTISSLPGSVLYAQNITGTIKDAQGDPLPGVVIVEKGTNVSAVSDEDGKYSIKVNSGSTLEFILIGYESKEALVSSTVIDVVLEESSEVLDNVVVTALGIKRETRALGYAISSVKGDDLLKAGVTANPLETLYGKAAGVGIQASASGPTGGIQIKIRGSQGLESDAKTRPLFVVDGVPIYDEDSNMAARGYDPLNSFDYGSGINDINAEDIESMEILKGAKASVLYGSQGANGVVLITTKSGAGTRGLGVSISYGHTWDIPYTLIDFQNEYGSGLNEYSVEYADEAKTQRRTISSRYNFGPKFDGSPILFFDGSTRPYSPYKNNYLDLFKNGSTDNLSVAISGGNDKGNMRLSFNKYKYNGEMTNMWQEKNSVSFNGTMKVSDFAEVEFINNLYFTNTQNRRPNLSTQVAWGTFNRDYDITAASKVYKTDDGYLNSVSGLGNIGGSGWGWPEAFVKAGSGTFNLLWNQYENRNLDERMHNTTSAKVTLKLLPFLSVKINGGIDYTEVEYTRKNKITSVDPESGNTEGGSFSYSRDKIKIQNYEGLLFFNKSFVDDNLNVESFVGGSYYNNAGKSVGVGTFGGLKFNDFWMLENGKGWSSNYDSNISSYSLGEDAKYSVMGQATISWKNTYYLELQARNDWSSTLPKVNRSYFYPGASFTWNFTENFTIPYINYGKLRLSLADVGRDASRYYAYKAYSIETLPAPNTNINKITGPSTLFSGDLKPERKREFEVGFNLRFFKESRLEVDFSYYNSTFYNQLMSVPLSTGTGASNIRINAGKSRNQGLELFVKGAPISTKSFQWELSATAAKQTDKIIDLYPGITQKNTVVSGVVNRAEEGERMGNLWMYDYVKDEKGNKIVNNNGYYQISTDSKDMIKVGNINPDIYGGLTSNWYLRGNWGVVNLMAGLDYKFGGKILSYSNYYLKGNGLTTQTLAYRDTEHGGLTWTETLTDGTTRERHDGLILDGVTADGEVNQKIIGAQAYYSSFIHDMSTGWQPDNIQKNDYIKFREIALGYTVPKKFSNMLKLQKLTFTLTARNLFYLYKTIENIDVESTLGTDSWVENSSYPSIRSYGFKINLSF